MWSSSDVEGECVESVADTLIECTLPELASGSNATFDIEVIAPIANFSSETITNTVSVEAFEFDPDMSDNTATATTQVQPRAELSVIRKEDSTDPVHAGDVFEYAITILNSGPSVATGVIVKDILPPGMQLIPTAQCTASDPDLRDVTCQVGQINAGNTVIVTFSVYAPNSGGLV